MKVAKVKRKRSLRAVSGTPKTRPVVAAQRGQKGSKAAHPPKPVHFRTSNAKPEPSRVDLFVAEYLVNMNGRHAAIRAGYSPMSARQTACDLLATAEVKAKLAEAMLERIKRIEIDQDYVVRRLLLMVEADPCELSCVVRRNCRYCWGRDSRYQFTHSELQLSRGEYARKLSALDPTLDKFSDRLEGKMDEFDTRGGGVFDPTADPNPECKECGGQGLVEVVFGDARMFSEGARLLYAGTKRTEKGMEVKMHSQVEALKLLGQHLGMFAQRYKIGGDPENPLPQGCGFAFIPPKRDPDTYAPVGHASSDSADE